MSYPFIDVISTAIIVLCGITAGYIVGIARGKRRGMEEVLKDDFPVLKEQDLTN